MKTLESILAYTTKAAKRAKSLAGALALGTASLLIGNAQEPVPFTIHITDQANYTSQIFSTNRQLADLYVNVDLSSTTNKIKQMSWKVRIPNEGIKYNFTFAHNPYFVKPLTDNVQDMFYPYPLEQNEVNLTNNVRSVEGNDGISKANGVAGLYSLVVLPTTLSQDEAESIPDNQFVKRLPFEVYDTELIDVDGNKVPSIGSKTTLGIIKDYSLIDKYNFVLCDINNRVPTIFVPASKDRQVLKATSDLANPYPWEQVHENDACNYNPNIMDYPWKAFSFTDADSTNHETRFYRVEKH